MKSLKDMKIKIFADMANIEDMLKLQNEGLVKGFTTNPSILKNSGLKNYREFAEKVLKDINMLPISFEVFADDFDAMEKQAREISSWGRNVFVKIPITNTKRESSLPLIRKLSNDGMQLNVTAIMTQDQVAAVSKAISNKAKTIISVFCGRIADTGRDPVAMMKKCVKIVRNNKNSELLWASSRELLNIYQADACGCHIITVTGDIIKKFSLINKNLDDFSLETVQMFYRDGQTIKF